MPGWVRFDDQRFGEPVYAAAGGGGDVDHVAVAAWLPESGRAIALASDGDGVTAEGLLGEIGAALVAGDPLPTPPSTSEPSGSADEDAADRAGTYVLDGGDVVTVTAADGDLEVTAGGPEAMAVLFPPADASDAEDRATHEDQVEALLAGETGAGRDEREALEGELGAIDRVDLIGTLVADGELRTYVTVVADEEALVWYALDAAGGIAAVEITSERPGLTLAPAGPATYRPSDPTSDAPDLTVGFGDGTMTLTGPDGAVTARADS
jgi:hypothetical protein